jgi:hypothetical protein
VRQRNNLQNADQLGRHSGTALRRCPGIRFHNTTATHAVIRTWHECCKMLRNVLRFRSYRSGRGMILQINEKPSEEKFNSGAVVYNHVDRTVRQITQSSLPFHNPHVTATIKVYGGVKVRIKALSIRNRVRDELVSHFCCFTLRIGTRQGGHQIWIEKITSSKR